MSKKSYVLIILMMTALVYMGAVRLYQWYEQKRQLQEAASREDGEPFSFQRIPVSLAAPQAEAAQDPVLYRPTMPDIYLEDVPLSKEDEQQQAQETIASILEDFNHEEAVTQFNEEVKQVSNGEVQGLEDLSTQNLKQIIGHNPQINHVIEKHLKNPDFAKAIQEIFENKQFQQSVQVLQESENQANSSTH